MRYLIYPYKQASEGAIAIATELGGQRILRENSKYAYKDGDVIINWGASDCPFVSAPTKALNYDVSATLNKLTFFQRLTNKDLTPGFAISLHGALLLPFPVFCRTQLKGRDGAGIVIADNPSQLVPCDLYVPAVSKTAEYRIHLGRLPNEDASIAISGYIRLIGCQKKVRDNPTPGLDPRVWAGSGTRLVWTVNGQPAAIPDKVMDVAIAAFKEFPELSFGAFDVVYNSGNNRAYVLEINSAPMMTPETVKRYGKFFRDYVSATAVPQLWTEPAVISLTTYLHSALDGFVTDPPDNMYQEGYEAALKEIIAVIEDGVVTIL